MMENKYYTPDIEDIRVGYECEQLIDYITHNEWKKEIFGKGCWLPEGDVGGIMHWYHTCIINKRLRTAYLTKEQIEDEGWNILQIYPNGALIFLKGTIDDGYELLWEQNKSIKITKVWSIFDGEKYLRSDIYIGDSPSINEFRYITNKLLKIK